MEDHIMSVQGVQSMTKMVSADHFRIGKAILGPDSLSPGRVVDEGPVMLDVQRKFIHS